MKYRWVDNNSDVRIAAVDLETGVIEINRQNWNQFSPFEKKYILLHEEGHYKLQTDSEIQADLYAINRVAGIEPKSLKKSIDTLYKVGILDETRIYELYKNALK
ncbi:MAG: hypothetical protein LBU51_01115 [Bacteroidales bacterium]|jgi:hypothetical protein|nr:hypothetical protein [Bacteroidales bacterium]